MSDTIEQLADELRTALQRRGPEAGRLILGITGVPGSGKSTLAAMLQRTLNAGDLSGSVAVVPMDGFHLPDAELARLGLRDVKGSPPTFDVAAYAELLLTLRQVPPTQTSAPRYDRGLHEPVAAGVVVEPSVRLVITEGNYLLLDTQAWLAAWQSLDVAWYLETPTDAALARVRARHIAGGCEPSVADRKIAVNDRPNAELVLATRGRANRIVRLKAADFRAD